MNDILLSPPVAVLIYLMLVSILTGIGRALAGPSRPSAMKASTYAGGESPPSHMTPPGYRPYFVIALFFAIVHLGALVLASGGLSPVAGIYAAGLMLTLLVLALS